MGYGELRGKVAVITGASSGIGRSASAELARRGARLVLAARDAGRLHRTADELRPTGAELEVIPTDVTDKGAVHHLIDRTVQRFGAVDIAVASAGLYVRGAVRTLETSAFERAMMVNFFGVINLFLAALPHMLRQKWGRLIAVSSVDGKKGLPLDAPYVASKFALNGFIDVLRQELHGSPVRVSLILPGRVDTPMIDFLEVPWLSRKIGPERVARAIAHAAVRAPAEVVIPWLGPKTLIAAQCLSPRLADALTRIFRLEGIAHKTEAEG